MEGYCQLGLFAAPAARPPSAMVPTAPPATAPAATSTPYRVIITCPRCTARQVLDVVDVRDPERWGVLRLGRLGAVAYEPVAIVRRAEAERCPCGAAAVTAIVRGRYSARTTCDERCTHAVRDECECHCGGAHHGAAWVGRGWLLTFRQDGRPERVVSATPEAIAQTLAALRDERRQRAAARAARESAAAVRRRAEWADDNPDVAGFLAGLDPEQQLSAFMLDMVRLGRRDALTPAQTSAVRRHMAGRAQARPQAPDLVEGRYAARVTIRRATSREGYRGRTQHRMLVTLPAGNEAWCTVPAQLAESVRWQMSALEGREVDVTATWTRDASDPRTGEGVRPVLAP